MKFKDTEYGDLTGEVYHGNISISPPYKSGEIGKVTSLEGCPKEVVGYVSLTGNPNLKSLQYCPKKISSQFACFDIGVEDLRAEVIKHQIYANNYYMKKPDGSWDIFDFKEIEKDLKAHHKLSMDTGIKSKGFRSLLGLDRPEVETPPEPPVIAKKRGRR